MEIYCESANYSVHVDWSINWRSLLSLIFVFYVSVVGLSFSLRSFGLRTDCCRRLWALISCVLLVVDTIFAAVDLFLLLLHVVCFWRFPYLAFDLAAEVRKPLAHRGSLSFILLASSFQGVLDIFFLPFAFFLTAHPLHTLVFFGAIVQCCKHPRSIPFRIFVLSEFFFAIFEAFFVLAVVILSLHRCVLLPYIYWGNFREKFLVPGLQRDGFHNMFWIFSAEVIQNMQDAWNDIFTVIVAAACFVPMILAPWRLVRAISLCVASESERKAFYRSRFTAKVVYCTKLLHDEIKDLCQQACEDCKNGRFLWMQYRMNRFAELSKDTASSIKELSNDLGIVHADVGLDAKPEVRRLVSSLRIVDLCASLQSKLFKDRCVLFPDKTTLRLSHAKDSFSFRDLIEHFRGNIAVQSHLEVLNASNASEFSDPESFEKLSQDLAADIGELDEQLQKECQYERLEKTLIKLHLSSSASHHSKKIIFDECLDKIIKVQTVTLQNIIKNMPPQPRLALSAYSLANFPPRDEIRVAFAACFMLALFDILVVSMFPLSLFRYKILISAFQSCKVIKSSRAWIYCVFRIAFRVFLDGMLIFCSVGILLSVVGTLPFISRMHDAWKSRSISYARNIIIVILRDFVKYVVRNLLSCTTYNFAVLFWSLFLVGFWAGFLPAMIVYVAANNIELLKNHKLLGCCFSFAFWISMAVIIPMYGLFINVAAPKAVGSEFGSVVWFLVIMIMISVVAAVHLSFNRDQSKPVFSAANQRLPTRKNFQNAFAFFDVILDGIQ
jgi:hypothetical protein